MAMHGIKSLRWFAPMAVVVGGFGPAACGCDDPADTVEVGSGNRAAQLTEAGRYVDLPKDPRLSPIRTSPRPIVPLSSSLPASAVVAARPVVLDISHHLDDDEGGLAGSLRQSPCCAQRLVASCVPTVIARGGEAGRRVGPGRRSTIVDSRWMWIVRLRGCGPVGSERWAMRRGC